MSGVIPWGHGAGCDFIDKSCLTVENGVAIVPDYGKGYFCTDASQRGCSPSQLYKMACTVIDYANFYGTTPPPPQFRYFPSKPTVGGMIQEDYCPNFGSFYRGYDAAQLDCRNSDNLDVINIYSEDYGENSMCFESTAGEGKCYEAACVVDEFVLKFYVAGSLYTCEYDFQKISVKTAAGTLSSTITCPRLSSVCPDMFCPANCAGRGVCNWQSNATGVIRPRCECFDPEDTSPGCSASVKLDSKYLQDSSTLVDRVQENILAALKAVFLDHPETWSTASWAWASCLFVLFLLMLLCICTSCWPSRPKSSKGGLRSDD